MGGRIPAELSVFLDLPEKSRKRTVAYYISWSLNREFASRGCPYCRAATGHRFGLASNQYGLNSVAIMVSAGGVHLNLALWAVLMVPAWLIVSNVRVSEEGDIAKEEIQSSPPGGSCSNSWERTLMPIS